MRKKTMKKKGRKVSNLPLVKFKPPKDLEFGYLVQDQVTGFEGVVAAKTFYPYDEDLWCLQARVKSDGSAGESQWFTRGRLIILEARAF